MRILSAAEVPTDMQGMWCRQSRLAGVVRFILLGGALCLPPFLGWHFRKPWILWPGAALAIVVNPLLLQDLAKMFRPTNWLLCIGPDGLWLNLLSYQDKVSTEASAMRFEYGEIHTVGKYAERYSTPSQIAGPLSQSNVSGSKLWKDVFLEIRLKHEETDELKTALNTLRSQPASEQSSECQTPLPNRYFLVWLVSPSMVRIVWLSSHSSVVRPWIGKALTELGTHVRIADPTEQQRPEWRELTGDEVEELAYELVLAHGAYTEATTLLVRAGRVDYADAKRLVQQIEAEGVRFR